MLLDVVLDALYGFDVLATFRAITSMIYFNSGVLAVS